MSAKADELLALYDDDLVLRYAPRTVETRRAHLRLFLAWLLDHGLTLAEVRREDLLAFQRDLQGMGRRDGRVYSVSHQAGVVTTVKGLYRLLTERQVVLVDPSVALTRPRQSRRLPRVVLSVAEVGRILKGIRGESPRALRDRAMVETLYATGVRVSELVSLTLSDVDLGERVLRITLGKGGKARTVPLTRLAAAAIERYLALGRSHLLLERPREELFVSDTGRRLQRAVVGKIITRWVKRVGIGKHVTCHTFRHSVATHLLKGRADIRHIQVLLGHKSLGTTEIYTRVEISDLKEVVNRAHPRGR